MNARMRFHPGLRGWMTMLVASLTITMGASHAVASDTSPIVVVFGDGGVATETPTATDTPNTTSTVPPTATATPTPPSSGGENSPLTVPQVSQLPDTGVASPQSGLPFTLFVMLTAGILLTTGSLIEHRRTGQR